MKSVQINRFTAFTGTSPIMSSSSRDDSTFHHGTWQMHRLPEQMTPWKSLRDQQFLHMGVSINRDTPKWMVYFMENPIKMDDLGVPLFLETPTSCFSITIPNLSVLQVKLQLNITWCRQNSSQASRKSHGNWLCQTCHLCIISFIHWSFGWSCGEAYFVFCDPIFFTLH